MVARYLRVPEAPSIKPTNPPLSLSNMCVLEPTTKRPALSRDIIVPFIEKPASPRFRVVVPAILIAFAAAVMTWPAIVVVKTRCGTWGANCTVLVPIMRTDDESKYIRELETVIGGASGVKVVPAMEIPRESGWRATLFIDITPGLESWWIPAVGVTSATVGREAAAAFCPDSLSI